VLTREHHEVDDGWLCDKGRFAYQSVHVDERITEPMIRDGGELRSVSWERALAEATGGLRRAGPAVAALAGGGATNEEGLLLSRLLRDVLGSPHLASSPAGSVSLAHWRALSDPALAASVSDLEFAHAVLVLDCEPLDDAPILELRIRKGVRRNGVRLFIASARPSALDPVAGGKVRFAPGRGAELVWALVAALRREGVEEAARAAGVAVADVRELARGLRAAGKEIVILYGEQVLDGDSAALIALAGALGLERAGAGLIGIPREANGRGLREVGVMPNAAAGLTRPKAGAGHDAAAMALALAKGELTAAYLLGGGSGRSITRRPSSPTPHSSRRASASTRRSSSRSSRAPRRRARSPIPTAASSAFARRSATSARCAASGASCSSFRGPSVARSRRTPLPR
jgi:NADH-quinone oxidoreductase subunit G